MKPENEGSFFKRTSIRYMIFVYFTVTALAASIFIGLSLYSRMSKQMSDTMQEENQILIDQLNRSVDVWLRGIMKLSDTTYYGIVKNTDLRNESVNKEMTLLYDNNKDNVENIALFSRDGELLEAVPATRLRTGADPAAEPWFEAALKKTENLHFSVPHVQRVFDAGENQYRWVISAARAVEITEGSSTEQGVLLIDIRYDSLEQLFDGITLGNGGYVYLLGADGELIYHPQSQLIYSGLEDENLEAAADVGAQLVDAVEKVYADLIGRRIEDLIADVGLVLHELRRTVRAEDGIAFGFILAEVELAARSGVFDTGAGHDGAIVVMPREDTVEGFENAGRQLARRCRGEGSVHALVDIEVVEFALHKTARRKGRQTRRKASAFGEIAHHV